MIHSALGTVDTAKAQERWTDVQTILYDRGAEILWGTVPTVDAVSSARVGGATPSKAANLNNWNFKTWYML